MGFTTVGLQLCAECVKYMHMCDVYMCVHMCVDTAQVHAVNSLRKRSRTQKISSEKNKTTIYVTSPERERERER